MVCEKFSIFIWGIFFSPLSSAGHDPKLIHAPIRSFSFSFPQKTHHPSLSSFPFNSLALDSLLLKEYVQVVLTFPNSYFEAGFQPTLLKSCSSKNLCNGLSPLTLGPKLKSENAHKMKKEFDHLNSNTNRDRVTIESREAPFYASFARKYLNSSIKYHKLKLGLLIRSYWKVGDLKLKEDKYKCNKPHETNKYFILSLPPSRTSIRSTKRKIGIWPQITSSCRYNLKLQLPPPRILSETDNHLEQAIASAHTRRALGYQH